MVSSKNGKSDQLIQSGIHPTGNWLCEQELGIEFVLEGKFRRPVWKEEEEHHRNGGKSLKGIMRGENRRRSDLRVWIMAT